MRIIRDTAAVANALDSMTDDNPAKRLLQQRVEELATYGSDIGDLARFVIIEPGDMLDQIEAELNLPIVTNAIDGSRYGQPDFTPAWEWIINHGGLFEAPYIFDDSGFGYVLIVPEAEGIDPELLDLCRHYAEGSEAS